MKPLFALIALLAAPWGAAWGQVVGIPPKQTIQVSFNGELNKNKVGIPNNPIIPFVPIEFSGTWPDSVERLTFRLLNTSTRIAYEEVKNDLSRLRSFNYGSIQSLKRSEMTALTYAPVDPEKLAAAKRQVDAAKGAAEAATNAAKASADDAMKQTKMFQKQTDLASANQALAALQNKAEADSTAFESYQADVLLDGLFDFKTIIKDPSGGSNQLFTVMLLAPQLRRYYGVQVLAEGPKRGGARGLWFATEGVQDPGKQESKPLDDGLPILYAGDLENLPHERFIPYSAVGVGFLGVDEHPAYPFLLTSVGLMVTARPVYSGVKNPFIHRYSQRGWGRPANWFMNRLFFSGGITTASLTYRGRALATSTVKGTVGSGLFLLPGLGVSFDCSFGGVANYNTAFDPRSTPFFMLGASLRFTGQVTQLFKSSVGASIDPQFSK